MKSLCCHILQKTGWWLSSTLFFSLIYMDTFSALWLFFILFILSSKFSPILLEQRKYLKTLRLFPWCLRWQRICMQCGRPGFKYWVGKTPGEGNGYPLQYCCLENSIDRGAWWATVHGIQLDKTEWLNIFMSKQYF